MKLILSIFCLCDVLLFFSCVNREDSISQLAEQQFAKTELPVTDFIAYVKSDENNLKLQKNIGDFLYTVQYIPSEYMALRDLKDSVTAKSLSQKTQELDELQYYIFSIEHNSFTQELLRYNLSEENEYYSRIAYFSFKMQDDLRLISGKDTLSCELFHFERTYNISPKLVFSVAFRGSEKKTDRTFSFNDLIFKNGTINLKFDKNTFTNLPKIKIS